MSTNGQILLYQSSATRTHFRCVARINLYEVATSIFRFVRNELYKLSPCHIRNTSIHATPVTVHHVLNVHLFKCDYAKVVHQLTAEFMRKVSTFISDTLMNMRQHLSSFGSPWCAFLRLTHSPLRSCESFFLLAKKTRIRKFLASGICGETGNTNIHADNCISLWKWLLINLTRKASIPIADSISSDSQGFDRSVNRSMKFDLYSSDLRKDQAIIHQFITGLRISETVVPKLAFESWIPWFLARLHSTEESLERKVNSRARFLQTLRVSIVQKLVFLFPSRYHPISVIKGNRSLIFFPRILSSGKRFVVNPSTGIKRLLHCRSLCFSGIEPILVGSFMHRPIIAEQH